MTQSQINCTDQNRCATIHQFQKVAFKLDEMNTTSVTATDGQTSVSPMSPSKRYRVSPPAAPSTATGNDDAADLELPISPAEVLFHRETLNQKHELYCKILAEQTRQTPFWDVIVITAADEAQRHYYESQLKERQQRNEIPQHLTHYVVVADPPGPKIGSGGSTMFVLEALHRAFTSEQLSQCKC
jgi:hypothetical protein